jgi:nucleoside-diphosphate-sugar epimerase
MKIAGGRFVITGGASLEKLERLLGWRPEVEIEEGLRRLIEWRRNEPAAKES